MTLTYNLPGHGMFTTTLYRYGDALYEFSERRALLKRIEEIDQLGALRFIFPGSHHTRYEYVFMQWTLISALRDIGSTNLPLSRNFRAFGSIAGEKSPSGSDILQSLALLTNIGHLPDTFASGKALLNILAHSPEMRMAFIRGLPERDRGIAQKLIDRQNIFQYHIFTAIFLLERCRGTERDVQLIDYSQALLRTYVDRSLADTGIQHLFAAFRQIRRMSYMALDSHYSPIPFTVSPRALTASPEVALDAILNSGSTIGVALTNLENVLRDSIYLAETSVLVESAVAQTIVNRFSVCKADIKTVPGVHRALRPLEGTSSEHQLFAPSKNEGRPKMPEPDWVTATLTFRTNANFDIPADLMDYEATINQELGVRMSRVGCTVDASARLFRLVIATNPEAAPRSRIERARKLLAILARFEAASKYRLRLRPMQQDYNNRQAVLRLALRLLFGHSARLEFRWNTNVQESPFFLGLARDVARQMRRYIASFDNSKIGEDQMHEITSTFEIIEKMDPKELVLCFGGSTRLFLPGSHTEDAEFDGIIFSASTSSKSPYLTFVEAKNMDNGGSVAQGQLRRQVGDHLPSDFKIHIIRERRAARAQVFVG